MGYQLIDRNGVSLFSVASGVETMPRDITIGTTLTMTSQLLRIGFFTAFKSVPFTKIATATGSTAAGATPSLCRVGLYRVDPATGDATLVARSANTTSLWASTNTLYETAFATAGGYPASYACDVGVRYGLAALCVTAATAPVLFGRDMGGFAAVHTLSPQTAATITGQADLPTSIAAATILANPPASNLKHWSAGT